MAVYSLEELSWVDVANIEKNKTVVFLPLSPIEAHGPHLPVATDIYCALEIARKAAEIIRSRAPQFNVVIGPAIPLGCAGSAADFPGTISLRGTTLSLLVTDVLRAFLSHGFKNLLVVNHHLDPVHMKAILSAIDGVAGDHDARIAELCSRVVYAGIKTELSNTIKKTGLDPNTELHADIKETSFIKTYYPDLLQGTFRDLLPVLVNIKKCMSEGKTTFRQMGADLAYMGTPAAATKDIGRRHLEEYGEMAAALGLKLIQGEELPDINHKILGFLEKHVVLD